MTSAFPNGWRDHAFVTLHQAADVLGLSRASIYRMAQTGCLTLKTLNGRTLVPVADLLRIERDASSWTGSERTRRAVEGRRKSRDG
jgi:hypothetical protein